MKQEYNQFLTALEKDFLKHVRASCVSLNLALLQKAFQYAAALHKHQLRKSGEEYIVHPVEVAKSLIDINLDTDTVAAGLLHDVVEDCNINIEEIKAKFGNQIAFLVNSVTKIGVLQEKSALKRTAGSYRKMMLSIAKDFRVVMIKFADRLHNMRTISILSTAKQRRIAKETISFYSPLANRFGLYQIRRELEDLSFKCLYPQEFKNLSEELLLGEVERNQYIDETIAKVEKTFKENKFSVQVLGRTKNLYGIYEKMKLKECDLKSVYDIFAVRILVKKEVECYRALGVVHQVFVPLMTRFKDYISLPKENKYQSLHTSVIGLKGLPIEVQIRTQEMDLVAEKGIAAHWNYKKNRSNKKVLNASTGDRSQVEKKWLEDFMQWQENLNDSAEFVDFLHLDVQRENDIFVFTPKGDLLRLYTGATVLDYAFAVHTKLGYSCIGAKLDGKMVSLSTVLKTGNTVEIFTSPKQEPLSSWLKLVTTSKATVAIRRFLKEKEQKKHIRIGKKLVEKEFVNLNVNREEILEIFKEKFKVSHWQELYAKVALGQIPFKNVVQVVQETQTKKMFFWFHAFWNWLIQSKAFVIRVSGKDGDWFQVSSCCSPVNGDKIIGYILDNTHAEIHRQSCKQISILRRNPEALKVNLRWKFLNKYEIFEAAIEVLAKDRRGILEKILSIFNAHRVNIIRASIITKENQIRDRFRVSAHSLEDLGKSLEEIGQLKEVSSALRLDGKKTSLKSLNL